MNPTPTRRQRVNSTPTFSSSASLNSFLSNNPNTRTGLLRTENVCQVEGSSRAKVVPQSLIKTRTKPIADPLTLSRTHNCTVAVLASPTSPQQSTATQYSKFLIPVPEAKPHEIMPRRRGRDSRRRAMQAEYFRRYMYLRRQLKPWSDAFREKYGRTPTLVDVHQADIPGLVDRFEDYLDAVQGMRRNG